MTAVGALTLMAACAPTPSDFREFEENGVRVVETIGDGAWAELPPVVEFDLEQVYGADEFPTEAILGNPSQLRVRGTTTGEVFVLDRRGNKLVAFAADGTLRWAAERPGEGPGEFNGVNDVGFNQHDNEVLVLNRSGLSIDFWSSTGDYLRSMPVPDEELRPTRIMSADQDYIRLSRFLGLELGVQVVRIDVDAPNSSFSWSVDVGDGFQVRPPSSVDVATHRDGAAVGSGIRYEIRLHDSNGAEIERWRRQVPYPVRPGTFDLGTIIGRHDFGHVRAPIALPGGYWLVHTAWRPNVTDPDALALELHEAAERDANDWRVTFDVFNTDGRFLQSIEPGGPHEFGYVDRAITAYPISLGMPIHAVVGVDDQVLLYTVAPEPFPQVRRYRMNFEPPG